MPLFGAAYAIKEFELNDLNNAKITMNHRGQSSVYSMPQSNKFKLGKMTAGGGRLIETHLDPISAR